jgi:hypothetical protein
MKRLALFEERIEVFRRESRTRHNYFMAAAVWQRTRIQTKIRRGPSIKHIKIPTLPTLNTSTNALNTLLAPRSLRIISMLH